VADDIRFRRARPEDAPLVSDILSEAATWLEQRGMPLWRQDELSRDVIAADVEGGLYVLAEVDGVGAAVVRIQLNDPDFWPDVPEEESVFVHRLAVRRRYAGGTLSRAVLSWVVSHASALDRSYVRLDCEASRPKLRRVYEQFGFRYHSDRQVGPYRVARYELPVVGAGGAVSATSDA
jgi:GNAT superfamily N-acetyltransferase